MPVNSPVHKQFDAMKKKGMPASKAAKIAQSNTGLALKTGKPPKYKKSY